MTDVSANPDRDFVPRDRSAAVYESADDKSGVSMIEHYWQLVRENKFLIAGIVALALAIGLIATLLQTPKYRASARIEIAQILDNVADVEGVPVETGGVGNRTYLPTQYQLLESRSLASRVVRELNLASDQQFLDAFDIAPSSSGRIEDRLAGVLLANVAIVPVIDSSLVDIVFVSPDPAVSAKVANGWASAYIADSMDRRFGATIEAREFLEDRLAQVRERLEDAEKELIEYSSNRDMITITTSSSDSDSAGTVTQTLIAEDLQTANQALAAATASRIAAESALAASDPRDTRTENSTLSTLRQNQAELRTRLAEASSRFGENYPPIRAMRAQLAQLESEVAVEEQRSQQSVSSDYQEALGTERRLRERVADLRNRYLQQRQDSVQYNILQRDVDTNRELYAGLLQRFREIGVVGVGENNVAIVDEARAPASAFEPNWMFNLLNSILIGIIVAALVILIYEQLNQSLRDPHEVEKRLGLPLLSAIPKTAQADLMDDIQHSTTELYESYFSLTSMLAQRHAGTLPKSIMVTSARPGEGKSLSSVALSYLLARKGKRILLIDSDLRHSGINKYISYACLLYTSPSPRD